jgi:hypothetical protein
MQKTLNFNFLKYLNYCDLINKYNFKSIYNIPRCENITLKVFIKQLLLTKFAELQLISFLFLYLSGFKNAYLGLKFIKALSKSKSIQYTSQIFFSVGKKKLLEYFFNIFLVLNKNIQTFSSYSDKNIYSKSNGKVLYQNLHLITFFKASSFIEKKDQISSNLNFNNLKIFGLFKIKKSLSVKEFNPLISCQRDSISFLKNILFFWVFN